MTADVGTAVTAAVEVPAQRTAPADALRTPWSGAVLTRTARPALAWPPPISTIPLVSRAL